MGLSSSVDDEDLVRLAEAGPLHSKEEVADFLDADEAERKLIIKSYRSSGVAATADAWDKFVSVAGTIVTIASGVAGITAAISGVYAVVHL
jgi:hypothetical protein